MKTTKTKKEQVIKYAASLGVTLTVSDKPSEKIHCPEKVEEANKMLSKMEFTYIK